MIRAVFFNLPDGTVNGFSLSGHADTGECGRDIVCAAVSSAAYLTANTVTEVLSLSADITEADGKLSLMLNNTGAQRAQDILSGFRLHMEQLEKQYPHNIKVEFRRNNDA